MGRYKKRELLYFGVDYIKANISSEKKSILWTLSPNSNETYIDFLGNTLTLRKMPIEFTDKYRHFFQITFEHISIGFIGFNPTENERQNFIEITGQGLTIFGVSVYYYLMKKLNLSFIKYKRVDICFDLEINLNYFYDKILDDKYKINHDNSRPYKTKKNGIETIYMDKKALKDNSYKLNRIYNKIVDSLIKDKLFLYADKYKNEDGTFKEVTRFETELREDLCKFYDYNVLKDDDFLYYRIVKSFYKYNVQYFKFLKGDDFKKIKHDIQHNTKHRYKNDKIKTLHEQRVEKILKEKENFIKYGNYFIDKKSETLALKTFISYAKKLYINGYSQEKLSEIIKNAIEM